MQSALLKGLSSNWGSVSTVQACKELYCIFCWGSWLGSCLRQVHPFRGVTGVCHSCLILFSCTQRDKHVLWSVLVWWRACFWLVRVFWWTKLYCCTCVRKGQLTKSSLSWRPGQGSSPSLAVVLSTSMGQLLRSTHLCLRQFFSARWAVQQATEGWELTCSQVWKALLHSTALLCLPCSQKRGLEQARVSHPCLLKLTRARRSHLSVAEGETEMRKQESMGKSSGYCCSGSSWERKAIKKVKPINSQGWVSPSVAVMPLTYFVILLHWVTLFSDLTLTTMEKKYLATSNSVIHSTSYCILYSKGLIAGL